MKKAADYGSEVGYTLRHLTRDARADDPEEQPADAHDLNVQAADRRLLDPLRVGFDTAPQLLIFGRQLLLELSDLLPHGLRVLVNLIAEARPQ